MTSSIKRVALYGAFLAAALSTGQAFASDPRSSASTSISNIQISVASLDASNPTPSFSFQSRSNAAVYLDPLAGNYERPNPDPAVYDFQSSSVTDNGFLSIQSSQSLPGISGVASVTSTSLVATAKATEGETSSRSIMKSTSAALESGQQGYAFVVNPYTSVTFTGLASVLAASDGASIGEKYWQNSHSGATASLTLTVTDGTATTTEDALTVSTPWNVVTTLSDSRKLTLTYSNTSDQAIHAMFFFYADAFAFAPSPVPEPGSFVLTFAGLAGAAMVARRRAVG